MADLSQIRTLGAIPSLSPAFGGPVEVLINLTRELRVLGIDAEIVTTNDNMPGVMDVPLGERIEYRGVPTYFFARSSARLGEFLFSADLTRWLWQHLKTYQIVTAHSLWSYAPDCLATIARWYGIPYGMRTMGQLTPWALAQGGFKKTLYANAIERPNLNGAKFIHCTAVAEAEDVTNFGITTPKFVTSLGVNQPEPIVDAKPKLCQRYGIPHDVPIVLFMSRLHPKKRVEWAIEVLGKWHVRQQPFHFLIAGDGDAKYVAELQQAVVEAGIQSQTSFTGFATGADKNLLLQGADLFVLPTHSENFGIALAEAMVAGLPIVTTTGVNIAPDIESAGAGIIVAELAELEAAIGSLLASPQLRQELGTNGRALATAKYAWPAIARQFADLYSIILDGKELPPIYLA